MLNVRFLLSLIYFIYCLYRFLILINTFRGLVHASGVKHKTKKYVVGVFIPKIGPVVCIQSNKNAVLDKIGIDSILL